MTSSKLRFCNAGTRSGRSTNWWRKTAAARGAKLGATLRAGGRCTDVPASGPCAGSTPQVRRLEFRLCLLGRSRRSLCLGHCSEMPGASRQHATCSTPQVGKLRFTYPVCQGSDILPLITAGRPQLEEHKHLLWSATVDAFVHIGRVATSVTSFRCSEPPYL